MNRLPFPPLAVTMGDPAGVGPAITCAAWHALRGQPDLAFYVVGDTALYSAHVATAEISSPDQASAAFGSALPVMQIGELGMVTPGTQNIEHAATVVRSIETAVMHATWGLASGVVTNPIHKAMLYASGFSHAGHTEFIAELVSTPDSPLQPVMMLAGGGLRVALATIHVPLKDVPSRLSQAGLVKLGRTVDNALRSDFGLVQPRLAFTGLNPHAGESGTIGTEEIKTINPAAAQLRREGVDIADARSADTVFAEALSGQFDAIIAMTHDQGLIPIKTLDMWGGVNMTLGLPIVRTSPDHGTGYDAAAKGTAKPDSLIAAIRLAHNVAMNRKNSQ